ncbi:MAG: indolepyruvate oxidoreductase subunit beta family protein [Acidimicrobiales bacterium]
MSGWYRGQRPITIAILAMGGEGGGVLADWIVLLGERCGYVAQGTSVAGVAQRTGATVYYIELYPGAENPSDANPEPVLSLFPTPGEVDIVVASELMEAGRAVQRGFCTPDRTVLIASTSRVYSMAERISLGDGRVDSNLLLEAAHNGSKRFIGADFMALAQQADSVISAALFGAVAGAAVLPFERADFENAIRESGTAVDTSLAAFALGFDAAGDKQPRRDAQPSSDQTGSTSVSVSIGPRPGRSEEELAAAAAEEQHVFLATTEPERLVGPGLRSQAQRVESEFPAAARSMLLRGCERTAVYQDVSYTNRYLDRVARVAAVEPDPHGDARLTSEAARHVALWMCYQDTIHVALQKIRRDRIKRVRAEARAEPKQLMQIREYLHPQADEITDSLPSGLGRRLARSKSFRRWVAKATRNGMVVNTTSVPGFSLLWIMARMRPMRPRSFRFGREQDAIDAWLDLAIETATAGDAALAAEVIECQRVLKGYGETHAHGSESFAVLLDAAVRLRGSGAAAETLADLRSAALADEDGSALQSAVSALATGDRAPV